jgi:hypothetical protein
VDLIENQLNGYLVDNDHEEIRIAVEKVFQNKAHFRIENIKSLIKFSTAKVADAYSKQI